MPDILLIKPKSDRPVRYNALGHLAGALRSPAFMDMCSQHFSYSGSSRVSTSPFDVKIIDLSIAPEDFDIRQYIGDNKPMIVGATSFWNTRDGVYEIGRMSKEVSPGSLRIVGGWDASPRPVDALKESDFQMVFKGEAEESLVEVATLLRDVGTTDLFRFLPEIEGHVSVSPDGAIIQMPMHVPKISLDDYPYAYYGFESLLFDSYPGDISGSKIIAGYLIGARGCVYDCIYCANRGHYAQVLRTRSAENVLREIKEDLLPRGFNYIHFWEENFTIPKNRALAIAKGISEIRDQGFDLTWGCQATGDSFDEELFDAFAYSGLTSVAFGVESGDLQQARTLKNRQVDLDACAEATRKLSGRKTEVIHYYLFNTPDESWRAILNTCEFMHTTRPSKAQSFILQDFPGCRSNGMARGLTRTESLHAMRIFEMLADHPSENDPVHIMLKNEMIYCLLCDLVIRSSTDYSDASRAARTVSIVQSAPEGSFLNIYFVNLKTNTRFDLYSFISGDTDRFHEAMLKEEHRQNFFFLDFGSSGFHEGYSFDVFHPDFLKEVQIMASHGFPNDISPTSFVKLLYICDMLWEQASISGFAEPGKVSLELTKEKAESLEESLKPILPNNIRFDLHVPLPEEYREKTFEYTAGNIKFTVDYKSGMIRIE